MATRAPWFRGRPRTTLAVAAGLFVAVFALRLVAGDATDAVSMLYALPIALVAVAFGARVGVAAGVVGVALFAGWTLVAGIDISLVGWVARVVPLLLLGYLLGDATDRLHAVEAERLALEVAAQRHRNAVEINDSLVQGMAAAKWSLEAGNVEGGVRTLTETMETARRLVSDLLRDADMAPDGARGTGPAGPATVSSPGRARMVVSGSRGLRRRDGEAPP